LIYIVADLFGHIDDILRNKVSLETVAQYYFYSIPLVLGQIIPIANLLASMFALGSLQHNNELIAMRAAGVSLLRIITPFVVIAVMLSGVIFYLNETAMPQATAKAKRIIEEEFERDHAARSTRIIRELAVYGRDNKIFYAKKFDVRAGTLIDPIILEQTEDLKVQRKIIATKAVGVPHSTLWKLYDVIIYRFNSSGEIFGEAISYDTKIMDFGQTPSDLKKYHEQTISMNFLELRNYIKRLGDIDRKTILRLTTELYHKIAFPLAGIVILFLGIPLAITTHRGIYLAGMGFSIMIALGYYSVDAIINALGTKGIIPPLCAAFGANILFIALGIVVIKTKLSR
jgi:lipopolysaccharide export system permease protein